MQHSRQQAPEKQHPLRGWSRDRRRSSCQTRRCTPRRGRPAPWHQPPGGAHLQARGRERHQVSGTVEQGGRAAGQPAPQLLPPGKGGQRGGAAGTHPTLRTTTDWLASLTSVLVHGDGGGEAHAGGAAAGGGDAQWRNVHDGAQQLGLGHTGVTHLGGGGGGRGEREQCGESAGTAEHGAAARLAPAPCLRTYPPPPARTPTHQLSPT